MEIPHGSMRIAHITDLHLVEQHYRRRSAGARLRLQYLNTGRSIDAESRCQHAVQALRSARGSDHILVTGDLTEDGAPEQFEVLAQVLADARVNPDRVTLVPGNHDFYSSQEAFSDALAGPLRPFARTSRVDRALDFGDVVILPTATTKPQPLPLSAGTLRPAQARSVAALASDCQRRGRTLILAQHHPPLGYRNRIWNWIDGMDRVRCFFELLLVHESLQVVHGHTHERVSSAICPGRAPQIHAGAAVFEDALNVRFYLVSQDHFTPLPAALGPDRLPDACAARASTLPGPYAGYGASAPGPANS
jgi:3',5'-cyclic-AMP phosphodiesterase